MQIYNTFLWSLQFKFSHQLPSNSEYIQHHPSPPPSRLGVLADLEYAGEFWNEIDRVQQIIKEKK